MSFNRKLVYGKPLFYPACQLSKDLAKMIGTTTVSSEWILFAQNKLNITIKIG